jgi:tetraacyldisaccharide 4'-kinase
MTRASVFRRLGTRALSACWSTASGISREAVRRGWVRSEDLGVRVVSVGNLQAGGAGKTPLVARICQEAAERGVEVCVLTRGYRGRWESDLGIIAPGEASVAPADSGDEAALLHELCPKAWIAVGADRVRAFREALARKGTPFGLVVLDDGFQHTRIRKDLEIVALTSASPAERLFRDHADALRYAHLRVWTKGGVEPELPGGGRAEVKVRFEPKPLSGSLVRSGSPLALLTGIGDGVEVRRSLEACGWRVASHLEFADHAVYTPAEVSRWLADSGRAGRIPATTGKDWVKIRALDGAPAMSSVAVFEPTPVFEKGGDLWVEKLWGSRS